MLIVLQPRSFSPEQTTIWSFPNRGKWATHSGEYRGNWSPYVPRNLILRYSKPGDWILDQFSGSGTTLVEAKLLNRNAVGVDINLQSVSLSEANLKFECETQSKIFVRKGDANIIQYSSNIDGDISLMDEQDFIDAMQKAASESYRVLKRGKYCAVMIGDKRLHGNVVPLGFQLMQCFLNIGFKSKEIIIKEQHNCKSTDKWLNVDGNFLMLAHEYIFVFYKESCFHRA